MKVTNKNGAEIDCTDIADLWHVAMWLQEQDDKTLQHWGKQVQETWHQAHAMHDHLTEEELS
jgi:cyclopropane fatty-acyl-phospholipid synthase-like methyltransferase